MPPISGVIITYNEEQYIGACIRSLQQVADEVVVVDSFSTDKTPEICQSLGVRFIKKGFSGHIEQKNFAVQQASYDHILSLDGDEILSDELTNSVRKVKDNFTHDAYSFKRLNNFCGKWMYATNLYPDRKIRLWDRRKGQWGGTNPHDKVLMQKGASVQRLDGSILHYMCDSLEEYLDTINRYTTIAAREAWIQGHTGSAFKVFYKTVWRFIRNYFLKKGFIAGYTGFVVSYCDAFSCFMKYVKLRNITKASHLVNRDEPSSRKGE